MLIIISGTKKLISIGQEKALEKLMIIWMYITNV